MQESLPYLPRQVLIAGARQAGCQGCLAGRQGNLVPTATAPWRRQSRRFPRSAAGYGSPPGGRRLAAVRRSPAAGRVPAGRHVYNIKGQGQEQNLVEVMIGMSTKMTQLKYFFCISFHFSHRIRSQPLVKVQVAIKHKKVMVQSYKV